MHEVRGQEMTALRHTDNASKGRASKARAKQDERDVARILGGKRHPADVGGGEDVSHPVLAIQVKGGMRVMNEVVRSGLVAARVAAGDSKRLPVCVVVDRSGTRVQRYVVIGLEEFADFHGFGGEA